MNGASKYWKASAVELFCDGVPISEACELSYKEALDYRDKPESFSLGFYDFQFNPIKGMPQWMKDAMEHERAMRELRRKKMKRDEVYAEHAFRLCRRVRKVMRKKHHVNWRFVINRIREQQQLNKEG